MDQEYVDELKRLVEVAKHPQTLSLLQSALVEAEKPSNDTDGVPVPGQDTEETKSVEAKSVEAKPANAGKVVSRAREPSKNLIRITNYGWDQSEKFVKIYINDMSAAKTENVHAEFDARDVRVEILDVAGKNYTFSIHNLYADIVPDQCLAKAKSGMVIISLRTKTTDKWQFLTAREKKLKDIKDQKAKLTEEDKADPSKSIMNMMKQMYQDGDDEMKRTIAKSWQEAQEKKRKGSDDFNFN